MAGFELVFSLDCTCGTLNTTFVLYFLGRDEAHSPELRGFYGLRGLHSYFAVA